jgi:arylformamidase
VTHLWVEHAAWRWRVAAEHAVDISIPIDFDGAQPAFFGAPRATAVPLEVGQFVGDVARGGSCDCSVLTLTPHCNGTHTESVGHLVTERVPVATLVPAVPVPCRLVTLTPSSLARSADRVEAPYDPADLVLDTRVIEPLLDSGALEDLEALVIRTTPNPDTKRTRDWGAMPGAYLTAAASRELAAARIEHLVVDLPSLDRADDGGRLAAHRAWWGLPARSTRLADATRPHCTVTELVYVADVTPDGPYLLNLQVAPFLTDAAPSRPLLLPLMAEA